MSVTSQREPQARARPALIVFAREPIAGKTKTRLIPGLGEVTAARLADAFINDALRKAAALGACRLVIAGSAPGPVRASRYFLRLARHYGADLVDQGDGHLGQRMARVLRPYAEPPGAVLFGTDIPSLPRSFLRQSMAALQHTPVVISPTIDGGYYLVGGRGELPRIFGAMSWGSGTVLEETLERLRRHKITYQLGRWWYDIDRPTDLELLAADLARDRNRGRSVCPATARLMDELGLLKLGPKR
ncbi:MAG: TIGR04282 family arsenosugar biosynthesis glycosyltransferase [Candidatus Binataceae bacterium]